MIQCGNPLWLEWLQEWMDIAELHRNKSALTLRKACESMARYPTPFHHPREAMVLAGIGEKLVQRLEERLARHCKETGEDMPVYGRKGRRQAGAVPLTKVLPPEEPKPKKPRKASTKQYVPKYRSGSFAILLALYQLHIQEGRRYMNKEEIIEVGQKFAEKSLSHADHGKYYTGWSSMSTLIDKSLVCQKGKDFCMSGEGKDMAERLKEVAIEDDPSKAVFFMGPTGADAKSNIPNNRRRAPSYSPEPARPTKQPRPTPRSKPVPKRPVSSAYDNQDIDGSNGKEDESDDDWGTTAGVHPASTTKGSSSSQTAISSYEPLNVDNDWDDNGYDDASADGYSSSQDDWQDNCQPSSTSTSLHTKENIPEPLPDLSRAPMNVLLDIAEAQSRGTVPASLNEGSTSTSTRVQNVSTLKDVPDSFPHLKVDAYLTVSGDKRLAGDISELAKFQPIYYPPGSFDVEMILDAREVRVQGDREYIPRKLKEQGIKVDVLALDIGDVIWVARPKNINPLLPEMVVLDHILERKRMDDLASSIKDGRFTEQKFRLSRSGIGHVIYLVETHIDGGTHDISQEGLRTAMTSTQVLDGCFLKRTGSTDQTIDYLVAMTNALKAKYEDQILYAIPDNVIERDNYLDLREYLRKKSPGRAYVTSYKAFAKLNSKSDSLTIRDNFVKMLMVVRGLSSEKAVEIAKVYGTPRAFFSALDKPGPDAPKAERRDIIIKSVSNIGRRKIGPTLASKITDLWYSKTYEKDPSQERLMPKPSTAHAAHGSSLTSAMLNRDNLAQHTQHHQELDESRDFVREFLDTLDPSSAPQADPGLEPVELTPDIVLRSPSAVSKPRTHESMQQQLQQRHNARSTQQSSQNHQRQQQHQQLQLKQNMHQQATHIQQHQPNTTHDKSKRKKVVKSHQEPQKRTNESQPILQDDRKHSIDGTRRKEGNGAVVKDDIRQGKKRKQEAEDVEQGVQNLDIRNPYTDSPSSREKRKRQTEGAITNPKGQTATKGKQAKNRLVQDGRRASNQQDEDKRKDKGKRAQLHDFADNQNDNGYDHHNHHHEHRHRRHHLLTALRQTSDTAVNNKPGKKDSNKPRKILTQSSLIMNQFVSPNVSKGRITIPGKLDHLGIFKKGKASKKTTVQQEVGNGFSEDAFLNQRTDSKESHFSERRQGQAVTSAYFADTRQDQDDLAVSKSSSSYGNRSNRELHNSASIASSIDNADLKSDVKEPVVASTHCIDCDRRDRRGASSYHSGAHSSQQQLNRTNAHGSAPTTHVSPSQPLEDVLDALLELNERCQINIDSLNGVQSPIQPSPTKYGPFQQPAPVQYIPAAAPFAGSYNEPYPYGYPILPPAPWQIEPYHNIPDLHQQQVYPVYDNTVYDSSVPPECPTVLDQRLQPIEYAVMNTDAEYDHDQPLSGHPPQPLSPPVGTHFRWRPHRLF